MGQRAVPIRPVEAAAIARLLEVLDEQKVSRRALAERAGIPRTRTASILNGEVSCSMSDFVDFCSALGLRASAVVRDAEARLAQTPTEADDFDWDAEIARNLREREEAARILANYDLAAHNVDDSLDDDNANV
jgi:hypothetical protein